MVSFMKKIAIDKAIRRIKKAKSAFEKCKASSNHEQYTEHWAEFLISSAAVFNILEAGCRNTPQGRQWYGGKRREGKNDPLVLHMRQARNEEEHGIEPVTKIEPGGIEIGASGEPFHIKHLRLGGPDSLSQILNPNNYYGAPPTVSIIPPKPVLLTITSKEGDKFPPPTEHLGDSIKGLHIFAIAELYISYIENIIIEAETHV